MPRKTLWKEIGWFIIISSNFLFTTCLQDSAHECNQEIYFKCKNGKCISKSFVCDGDVDCGGGDRSDEEACHLLTTKAPSNCHGDEYQCLDKLCIPSRWVCDGEFDCADGSDETHGCTDVECDGFLCTKSRSCIPKEWKCDGAKDCPDSSDEEHCPVHDLTTDDCSIHDGKYICADRKKCIKVSEVCNRHADCEDGSDEGKQCFSLDACSIKNCSHNEKCVLFPEGPQCIQICSTGYKFHDGICEDINECDNFGTCEQVCTNFVGGYNCSCAPGYVYSKEHGSCKAEGGEGLMMFSSNDQIRAYFVDSKVYYQVAGGLPHATAIAYDGISVYWTTIGAGEEAIVKSNEHGGNQKVIITSGLGSPEDLAIDWITKMLYFTDPKYKRIGVCTSDGLMCTVLHNKDIDQPRALVLHSAEGLMYWSDWGEKPMIARSGMDGTNVYEFINDNIHWPNGLSLDLGSGRLFWVDAKESTVECIKLDGTDRRKIPVAAVKHPFSVEVFEDKIYWSDWDSNEIKACNKFTGHDCEIILKEKNHKIYGIHIYHPSMSGAKVANPCLEAHCSDMCLLSPKNYMGSLAYSCACPYHKKLTNDFRTCEDDSSLEAIMVGSGQTLFRIEHKMFGGFEIQTKTFHHIRKIGAITFDPISEKIIMSDLIMKVLVSWDWKTGDSDVIADQVGRVIGLDIDYYSHNLYWVDEERKTLEVMSMNGFHRRTLLRDFGHETPTDLALVLDAGYMFVACKDGIGAHVDRLTMDGRATTRSHIIEKELLGPISLSYDVSFGILFIADRNGGLIMTTDGEGFGRHKFIEMTSAPVDVTSLDNDVFWTTYGSNKLYWAHKYDPNHYAKQFVLDELLETDQIRLIGIHTHPIAKKEPCAKSNCSHLCLLSGSNVVCACPDGMELDYSKQNCKPQVICHEDQYKCSSGECILRSLRCNGHKDCRFGDDEEHCVTSCPLGHFACANGRQCISHAARCNNKPDCDDSSDEHNCDTGGVCGQSEFRCGTGECIPAIGRCDTKDDCFDGSDEENCANLKCHSGEFRCSSGSCIPASWECDHQIDCVDGSDEGERCGKKEVCKEFTCGNGHCIAEKLKCNGEDDCDDMSDEVNCPTSPVISQFNASTVLVNSSHVCPYFCPTDVNICLPLSAKCNGREECPGGEDEEGCSSCSEEQFACLSKKCIPKSWHCDNINDCGDFSDELHCANKSVQLTSKDHYDATQCDGFLCKESGLCLGIHKLCDSHPDCPDGSDEKGLCDYFVKVLTSLYGTKRKEGCEHAGCSQLCQDTPSGPRCQCHPGYLLAGDSRTCNDINECDKRSSCSQLCFNTLGSYKCSCIEPHYRLRSDKVSCKAKGQEMKYYYATDNEIKFKTQSLQETGLIFRWKANNMDIKGMAIDMQNSVLYLVSEMTGQLIKMSLNNGSITAVLTDLVRPSSVAYDWVTENVYILENNREVRVVNFKTQRSARIYTGDNEVTLSHLDIDPISRIMVWVETTTFMVHNKKSVLMKSSMSGENVEQLLNLQRAEVGGLILDSIRKLVYWSERSELKIERCSHEGKDREVVLHNELPASNLMMFEDYLYWLNEKPKTSSINNQAVVGTITKFGLYGVSFLKSEEIRLLPRVTSNKVKATHIFHPSLQPLVNNSCKRSSCHELCVLGTEGVACLCESGEKLKAGDVCKSSGKTKTVFKSLDTEERSSANWAWFWWIFSIISFAGLAYATYYLYSNFFQQTKLGGNFSVFFPVHRQPGEESSPVVQTTLLPGQHSYENPIFTADKDSEVKLIIGNEINIK